MNRSSSSSSRSLATTTSRSTRQQTRLLVVRESPRSVRASDYPSPGPMRLALGLTTGIGSLILLWLIGEIGHRLGYAATMQMPELTTDLGGSFASAVRMLASTPVLIFEAATGSVELFMLFFLLVLIPAGGLSAARPITPGGPRPKPIVPVFGWIGAIAGALNACAVLWWVLSPLRLGMIRTLPSDPGIAALWVADLQQVAGFDSLMLVAAALWVVLVFRLPTDLWLKVLASIACIIAAAVIAVGYSISAGAAAHVTMPRPLTIQTIEGDRGEIHQQRALLIGSTDHQAAMLTINDAATSTAPDNDAAVSPIMIELRSVGVSQNFTGTQPIAEFLAGAGAEPN